MSMFEHKENMKRSHNIPIGQLVEVNDSDSDRDKIRLYVTEHRRDVDGTPLYSLGMKGGVSLLHGHPEHGLNPVSR